MVDFRKQLARPVLKVVPEPRPKSLLTKGEKTYDFGKIRKSQPYSLNKVMSEMKHNFAVKDKGQVSMNLVDGGIINEQIEMKK